MYKNNLILIIIYLILAFTINKSNFLKTKFIFKFMTWQLKLQLVLNLALVLLFYNTVE